MWTENNSNRKMDRMVVICPRCGSTDTIKHGKRETSKEEVQIYMCKGCDRVFSFTELPYLNNPPPRVLKGISLYNQGYSLKRTSDIMNHVYGEKVPRNTIHHWVHRYGDLFTYTRLRDRNESRRQIAIRDIDDLHIRIHRKKLKMLGDRFQGFSRYARSLLRTSRIKKGESSIRDIWKDDEELLYRTYGEKIEYHSEECRLISMMGTDEPEHPDIKRTLIINDAFTVSTNMPISFRSREFGNIYYWGVADIVQIRDGWFQVLRYSGEKEDQIRVMTDLLGVGEAFHQRCFIPKEKIRVGAFDRNRMWLVDYPIVRE